jgi:ABC-2 type transport system ATP-binding protein
MLTIESLNKSYGSKHVLKNLSLSFADGQVHGVIGLNGAGKTTFFNCICGMLDYEGIIKHDRIETLKNHIGYVPTEPYFFPRTKGKEYLEFIRHAKEEQHIDAAVLQYFDLPLDEYVDNYSTGMKRKIAFMGAMIGSSDIYILDEPFNGVDIKSNLVLKKKILDLKAQGKMVLLSSHIISSLAEICDDVYMLKDGIITRHYMPEHFAEIETDMLEL